MSAKISAQIVADSINPQGDRIITYLLTFPRFILAELNTHRVFSKNSASSRAIPFKKMVEMVETDPFIPIAWQKHHSGMQGSEYFTKTEDIERNTRKWLIARDNAINSAKWLNAGFAEDESDIGVTKQLCNRLLEPFMWHTVLLTGTEFENFFKLRCPQYLAPENSLETIGRVFRSKRDMIQFYIDNDFKLGAGALKMWTILDWLKVNQSQAEIHMQALAEAMWDAYNESTPKELKAGEWHIPFSDKIDSLDSNTDNSPIERLSKKINHTSMSYSEDIETLAIKISTARCARLSYMTFDGKIDYEKDLKLHDTLLESQHMSPFEHCARAMGRDYDTFIKGELPLEKVTQNFQHYKMGREDKRNIGWCNNYKGFIQYRYLIENNYDGFNI